VAPLKKKLKSGKSLKINDFQGFLFSPISRKRAISHVCGGGIGDFFEKTKKGHQSTSNDLNSNSLIFSFLSEHKGVFYSFV